MLPLSPKRTLAHRVDTLAMKKVSLHLGADLLIRSIDERDYGVDALVEYFEGNDVGQLLFLQVKGTGKPIVPLLNGSDVSLPDFPKKTMLYAEQFIQPFIVAYTSVEMREADTSPIYWIWLQDYIERTADKKQPNWRLEEGETMPLHLPLTNVIATGQGDLKALAKKALFDSQCHRFIKTYARLQALEKETDWSDNYGLEVEWIVQSLGKCERPIVKFRDASDFESRRVKPLFDAVTQRKSGKQSVTFEEIQLHRNTLFRGMNEIAAKILLTGAI
jgi:hypothetical protein